MIKKLVFVAVAVVAGLFLLNTTNLGSYASTAWKKVRASCSKQVPLEFEIERVRNEIAHLGPDMKDHLRAIADETVKVENLREEIASTRIQLVKQKENILAMRKDVDESKGKKTIWYGEREFPVSRVKDKLTRDFASYQHCEEALKNKERLLESKEAALSTAKEQLTSMRSRKEELEVEVARLESDLKNLRLAQTRSNFQLDDTRLARINASLASIRDRLKADTIVQDQEGQIAHDLEIQVEKKAKTAEVLKQIDDYFGKEKNDVAVEK